MWGKQTDDGREEYAELKLSIPGTKSMCPKKQSITSVQVLRGWDTPKPIISR